jgi:hypothetical protein
LLGRKNRIKRRGVRVPFQFADTTFSIPYSRVVDLIPIDELRRAFAKCYGLMAEAECVAFREGLDDEWDVATVALTSP